MVKFAKEEAFDYVVVAQDDPLALGMVDALAAVGIPAFGPDKAAARIEASKVFSKDLMKKYGIPTAKYETFDDPEKVMDYIKAEGKYPVVIKADGLALGKGVLICQNEQEAADGVKEIMLDKKFGASGNHVVVEEFLTGPEVSVLSFCDGKTVKPMVSSMDHKRALDHDEGLNTGGMGTVAPNPYYTPAVAERCMQEIFLPTVAAMQAEGCPFKGCLYFGLMLTPRRPEGHRVQLPLRRPRDAGRAAPAGKRPADRDGGHNERHAGQDRCQIQRRRSGLCHLSQRRLSPRLREGQGDHRPDRGPAGRRRCDGLPRRHGHQGRQARHERRARAGRDRHGQHPARGAEKRRMLPRRASILTSCTSAVTLEQERWQQCSKKASPSREAVTEGD